jgi:hypothetical protein
LKEIYKLDNRLKEINVRSSVDKKDQSLMAVPKTLRIYSIALLCRRTSTMYPHALPCWMKVKSNNNTTPLGILLSTSCFNKNWMSGSHAPTPKRETCVKIILERTVQLHASNPSERILQGFFFFLINWYEK